MSRRNGDKARFGKEQQKKLRRRKLNLALRQSLSNRAATSVAAQGQAAETNNAINASAPIEKSE